jgi:gas vesicle protein
MKGQKESRVDLVEKKIKALINVIQGLMNEISQVKDLSMGTLETIKLMPDYELALKKLMDNLSNNGEDKETDLKEFEGLDD